jgi:hypothetical protein
VGRQAGCGAPAGVTVAARRRVGAAKDTGRTRIPVTHPYARVFLAPGTAQLEVAGFAARMAHLMTVLGVIFIVSAVTAYGVAGTSAGAYALAYSLASRQSSRLADRHGQGRVLALMAVANAARRAGFLTVV